MKKYINSQPMDLWNAGDLLDYLDECINDSQILAAELVYAADNTDNKVDNVFTTPEFDKGVKDLIKKHKTADLKKLKAAIKQLLYEGAVTTRYHNHGLKGKNGGNPNKLNELHISGEVLLHYRYWGDNTLIISLGLVDVMDHKRQKTKVSDKHRYQEKSREFSVDAYDSDDKLADDIVDIKKKSDPDNE